jgi:hypothetical protein
MSKENQPILNNFKINSLAHKKYIIISLFSIAAISFFLRLNFVSFELPVTLDALLYFWYANDMSQLGHFPHGYNDATNNGWPSFLSLFFSAYQSSNFLDYMILQRIITISISVSTIIPIYFLCRRFVPEYFAIFGAALFAFEPRLIQNSLLGITEPLFILLLTLTILLFLKERIIFIYSAFALLSLVVLVRGEAIVLFLPLSIGFIWKFRKNRSKLIKYIVCVTIFVLILFPMLAIRIDTTGEDGIFSRLIYSSNTISQNAINQGIESGDSKQFILLGIENFVKFLGWGMIPVFLVFVPYGLLLILKQRDFEKRFIIFVSIILTLPMIYAFSVASDTRFLFSFYPLFCIASVIAMKSFSQKIGMEKKLIIFVIFAILLASIIYLDYKKNDIDHEKEALELAKIVALKTEKINLYSPESQYLAITEFDKIETFPIIRSDFSIPYHQSSYGLPINVNFNSTNEAMKYFKENDFTHLIIDKNEKNIISNIFHDDEAFPFLEKEYDSSEHGYDYSLKIFKINYEKFDKSFIINEKVK